MFYSSTECVSSIFTPKQIIGNSVHNVLMLDAQFGIVALKKIRTSIGAQYFDKENLESKLGVYFNVEAPIYKNIRLTNRMQYNSFDGRSSGVSSFTDVFNWLGLRVNF